MTDAQSILSEDRRSESVEVGPRIVIADAHLRYPILRDRSSLKAVAFGALGFSTGPKVNQSYVHALKGIDLTINRGERVGFIGSNGAGKSTLLRAVAGVYPLHHGRVEVTGTVQGLFDLGIGFEAEATGRENILYRGLSMGVGPARIRERAADIVDFADLGEFIDLPMRTYSAGMFVRLGFAISTYLEGDILLIDEVFGAGDAAFQERARARMRELIERAGILLFVSHDLAMLRSMCSRVVWLSHGEVELDGEPALVIERYLKATTQAG